MNPNPFRPGFNQVPAVLAGRDEVLDAADEAIAVVADEGRTPPPLVLVGPRGVGKTVLVHEIGARAAVAHGWPHVAVEASLDASLAADLADAASTVRDVLQQRPAKKRPLRATETVLRAQVVGIGAEMHLVRDPEAVPEIGLRRSLDQLLDAALVANSGLVISIDEAQQAQRADLGAFAVALQRGIGLGWPVVAVLAGLDSLRDPDRLPTYFERAEWHELGSLDAATTVVALSVPAAGAGRPFEPGVATWLAGQTNGYPYAIQLYGHHAWRAAEGFDRIDMSAARSGATMAAKQLAKGLIAQRWTQASGREREYLSALAAEQLAGRRATGAGVAKRLGARTSELSSYRARLIRKGILVDWGDRLDFAVPGMGGYVLSQGLAEQAEQRVAREAPSSEREIEEGLGFDR